MRDLTSEELTQAPTIVQFIYLNSMMGLPVGISSLNDAIEQHPEYFPDEVEHRNKWEAIPDTIHKQYWDEREELTNRIMKDVPKGEGFIWHAENPKKSEQVQKAQKKAMRILKPLEEKLHKKHYAKYGIEYSGWL